MRGMAIRWGIGSLGVVAAVAVAVGRAPSATAGQAVSAKVHAGQWIWTARDRQLFERARRDHGELEAAVFIGTVERRGGVLRVARGLSPTTAGQAPRALVVRLDDSVNGHFDEHATAELSRELDALLTVLLGEVRATGVSFGELQLDYDAPESKLKRWAAVLHYLKAHALREVEVWITSLPVHVDHAEYGDWMRGAVTGHILQVFDTGLTCDAEHAQRLREALRASALPFRIGYGAFERKRAPDSQAHECWLSYADSFRKEPAAAGFWLFPAGFAYERSLSRLAGPR